jgi:nucleotide-binding universal stress UspA family protein
VKITADDEPTPAEQARRHLETAIRASGGEYGQQTRTVTPISVRGEAPEEFVHRGAGVDLIVLGAHHRGTMIDFFSGSTTRACVTHSPVPVVVVPAPKR